MRHWGAARRIIASLVSAGVAASLAGCAIPIISVGGLTNIGNTPQPTATVAFAPWGPEYDDLAALTNAAMDQMRPADDYLFRLAPQPATPTNRWTVVDEGRSFSRGTYRLTAFCAGTGILDVSYVFQLGSLYSTGVGNFVTCEPGTTVSVSDIELPIGASHLRIEVNPVDMYGNPTQPRAALGFTIERAPN